jgi:D-alanyl-D-alanine carboxypeptidase-like protein
MEVSAVCRKFIEYANKRDWKNAVLNLNVLSMYEMLRSLKALDPADIPGLRTALATLGGAVNGPRIDYALKVVVDKAVPAKAPGDLATTGQVDTSLTAIMASISANQRLVYRALGTAGMHCARNVRGSTTNISNHSWGTAIDLTIERNLDPRGDSKIQFGLHLISTIFNGAGWYWGAGFPTEDAQHFEAGASLVQSW